MEGTEESTEVMKRKHTRQVSKSSNQGKRRNREEKKGRILRNKMGEESKESGAQRDKY